MYNKKKVDKVASSTAHMDATETKFNMRDIMKDIEHLSSSHMTWKERKELENKKVVSLGGKAVKKQRLPLSVARVQMKKQKERDEKMQKEGMILGRFGADFSGGSKKSVERRRPEDRVLKPSEGYFRNGILDVKHLLRTTPSGGKGDVGSTSVVGKWKENGKGKGKVKGNKRGGMKRH